MTAKQIAGYLKARRDQSKSTFGGISFNDGYNVPTYGITQADYYAIDRSMNDEYGMMASSNLTTAGVKKALGNHPISAKGPSVHHATKKSPAQLQREIDEVLAKSGKASSKAPATNIVPSASQARFQIQTRAPGGEWEIHSGVSAIKLARQWARETAARGRETRLVDRRSDKVIGF